MRNFLRTTLLAGVLSLCLVAPGTAQPKEERDMLMVVLETEDGEKNIHKQMVKSEACRALLKSFAKAQAESAPFKLTDRGLIGGPSGLNHR